MAVERTIVRRARKDRPCSDYWCSGDEVIRAGELYNHHVASPGLHEWGDITRWRQHDECGTCAKARTGKPITKETTDA